MELKLNDRQVSCTNIPGRGRSAMAVAALVLAMGLTPAYAADGSKESGYYKRDVRTASVRGRAVSGPNDVCGVAQWTMPAPFPPDAHFTVLGVHDETPNATNSLALTPDVCENGDALLATHTSSALNALGGFPDADPRVNNVPLRQVQVKTMSDGTRLTLPSMGMSSGNPFPPTKSEPNDDLTVGDWFSASGEMHFRCYPDGTARVRARFRNLIPNGVYGLYATWLTVPPGQTAPTFMPLAFGGVPNVMIPDKRGRARFDRTFSYCPLDTAPDGSFIMFINAGYHADGIPGGVMPQTIMEAGRFTTAQGEVYESIKPPGSVTIPHVQFPIGVE